jgi:hypothetical protein
MTSTGRRDRDGGLWWAFAGRYPKLRDNGTRGTIFRAAMPNGTRSYIHDLRRRLRQRRTDICSRCGRQRTLISPGRHPHPRTGGSIDKDGVIFSVPFDAAAPDHWSADSGCPGRPDASRSAQFAVAAWGAGVNGLRRREEAVVGSIGLATKSMGLAGQPATHGCHLTAIASSDHSG